MKPRCLIVNRESPVMAIMQSYVHDCQQPDLLKTSTDAIDYLVKPFSSDHFLKVVNQASDRINNIEANQLHADNSLIPIGRRYKEEVENILNRFHLFND